MLWMFKGEMDMRTYYLTVDSKDTAASLHEKLKRLLAFPAYYGGNLDALNDCLSERKEKCRLWIRGAKNASQERQSLLAGIETVFQDNGNTVLWLD